MFRNLMRDLWDDVQESFGYRPYGYHRYYFANIEEWLLDKFFAVLALPFLFLYVLGMMVWAAAQRVGYFFRDWWLSVVDSAKHQSAYWMMLVGIFALCGCVFGVVGVVVGGVVGVVLSGLLHLAKEEDYTSNYSVKRSEPYEDGGFMNLPSAYYGNQTTYSRLPRTHTTSSAASTQVYYAQSYVMRERYHHPEHLAPREDDMRRDRRRSVRSTL